MLTSVVDDSPILNELQAWFALQISQPQFFYNITSAPQPSLRNRTFPILIGKVVGGSSAVNAMMAIRGSKQDYDQWGALFGKSSAWTWEGMLPYFKKAVRFTPPDPNLAPAIPHDASLWATLRECMQPGHRFIIPLHSPKCTRGKTCRA